MSKVKPDMREEVMKRIGAALRARFMKQKGNEDGEKARTSLKNITIKNVSDSDESSEVDIDA